MSSTSTIAMTYRLPEKAGLHELNLSFTRDLFFVVVAVATLLQLLLNYSTANLEMSIMLLISTWIGAVYIFKKNNFIFYPISSLMLLGYVVYHYVVPPIGQLFELHGITYSLHRPVMVEVYDFVGLISLLSGHLIYRKISTFRRLRDLLTSKFYGPLGFFLVPAVLESWLLGVVGIVATIYVSDYSAASSGGVAGAILRVLQPLTYIPYLAVNPALADPSKGDGQRLKWLPLMLYTVVVFAVSFVTNSRGFMLLGLASLALAYLCRVFSGSMPAPKISLKGVIVLVCVTLFVTGPVTNIAASMLIARRDRSQVSRLALVEQTWKIYRSGVATKAYYAVLDKTDTLGGYDEAYYNNLFLNRIGNIKFDDLSISAEYGSKLVGDLQYFREVEFKKSLALFPAPVIKLLSLNVNKTYIISGSSEDFLYQEATGNPIGGFKVGSLLVLMHATFGMIWPIILIVMAALIFSLADALCLVKSYSRNVLAGAIAVISPLAIVTLYSYGFYFGGSGPQDFPGLLAAVLRSWLQVGILYGFVFLMVRWLCGLITPRSQQGVG